MPHHDLMVIGTGSGNSVVDPRFADQDVAIVEQGTFGGTCLNVGCIPTKMYVHTADVASGPRGSSRFGVDEHVDAIRWPEIRDRIFGRIDPIAAGGEAYRSQLPYVTVYREHVQVTGPRQVETASGQTVTADRVVVAAGGRPRDARVPGLTGDRVHTSDTIMRIDEVPARLAILGGGYIAAEMAHVFSSLGSRVTIICPREGLLMAEDRAVRQRFTEIAREKWTVLSNSAVTHAEERSSTVALSVTGAAGDHEVEADLVLVAIGRVPNTDTLEVAAAGLQTRHDGTLVVDEWQRTSDPAVFALGDICNAFQLKHVANHEARVVQHNLLHPGDLVASDHRHVPWAIFSSPQIAGVGRTEDQLIEAGVPYVSAIQGYDGIAYGWAMEDTTGFVKLLADPDSKALLGAHVIGPQAPTVVQPLIQAISFGLTADRMARGQYWIHPAMPEVVENALLQL